jgi:transcriptional regulator with XRE-family HTH domain
VRYVNRSKSGRILWAARRRAGFSQRQLAAAAHVPQPAISRIERGVVAPSLETLDRLVRACGMELQALEQPGVGLDRSLIAERLAMTPGERARRAALEWERTAAFRGPSS